MCSAEAPPFREATVDPTLVLLCYSVHEGDEQPISDFGGDGRETK